jgi:hypothetical protein
LQNATGCAARMNNWNWHAIYLLKFNMMIVK